MRLDRASEDKITILVPEKLKSSNAAKVLKDFANSIWYESDGTITIYLDAEPNKVIKPRNPSIGGY